MGGRLNREKKKKLKRIRVDRALVVPYRNIMLIPPFLGKNNFFGFVLFCFVFFFAFFVRVTTHNDHKSNTCK